MPDLLPSNKLSIAAAPSNGDSNHTPSAPATTTAPHNSKARKFVSHFRITAFGILRMDNPVIL